MDKKTIKDINQKDNTEVLYGLFLSYEKMSDRNEKLASAIFLLSDHIKDNEPIKNYLRQKATVLATCYADHIPVKKSLTQIDSPAYVSRATRAPFYSYSIQADKAHCFYDATYQCLSALISLTTVAYRSGMISSANFEIMIQNLHLVLGELQAVYAQTISPVPFEQLMGNSFDSGLAVAGQNAQGLLTISQQAQRTQQSHRRPPVVAKRSVPQTAVAQEGAQGNGNTSVNTSPTASSAAGNDRAYVSQDEKVKIRQQRILDFVKGHPASTISDIISVITDYSEKTVQRELINLIGQNLLRREGERRWSRYSAA